MEERKMCRFGAESCSEDTPRGIFRRSCRMLDKQNTATCAGTLRCFDRDVRLATAQATALMTAAILSRISSRWLILEINGGATMMVSPVTRTYKSKS